MQSHQELTECRKQEEAVVAIDGSLTTHPKHHEVNGNDSGGEVET